MRLLFAVLPSVFAALASILAKVGIDGVSSDLAAAIRTVVVLVMAWGMVFVTGRQEKPAVPDTFRRRSLRLRCSIGR